MGTSPINRMIDAACSVPIESIPERDLDQDAEILLAVAAAAKAWRKHGPRSAKHEKATQRLKDAADRWIAIGG